MGRVVPRFRGRDAGVPAAGGNVHRPRIGQANGTELLVKARGWLGIATAIAAWYASFASVTNKTFGRIVLPVREFGQR